MLHGSHKVSSQAQKSSVVYFERNIKKGEGGWWVRALQE